MAWNEPGGNRNGKDPWGNKNGGNQGPPDLDEALKQFMKKINGLFGSGSGGGSNSSSGDGQGAGGVIAIVAVLLIIFLAFKSVFTID